jgi:hypothetical protein
MGGEVITETAILRAAALRGFDGLRQRGGDLGHRYSTDGRDLPGRPRDPGVAAVIARVGEPDYWRPGKPPNDWNDLRPSWCRIW